MLNSTAIKAQKSRLNGVPGLKLKTNAATDEVIIDNVYLFEVNTMEDAFKYFWKGLRNKVMSSHNMNNASSRSHAILTFIVTQ